MRGKGVETEKSIIVLAGFQIIIQHIHTEGLRLVNEEKDNKCQEQTK